MPNTPSSVPPPYFDPDSTDALSQNFNSELLAQYIERVESVPRIYQNRLLSSFEDMRPLEEQDVSDFDPAVSFPSDQTIGDLQEEFDEMVERVIFSELPDEEQKEILDSLEEGRRALNEKLDELDNDSPVEELSPDNVEKLAKLTGPELKQEMKELKKRLSDDDLEELQLRIDSRQIEMLRDGLESGEISFLINKRKEEGWEDPE